MGIAPGIRVQFTLSNFRHEKTKQKQQGVKPLEHENVEIEFSSTYPDAIKIIHVQIFSSGLPRVREKSGKNKNFLQVRELSGNFEKMSGNFGHLTNVREMSGNFVMTIKFF